METVTLSGRDFKTVHNTLCELRNLVERMTYSMIKIDDVQRIVEGFEAGLRDAYAQDNTAFDSKMDYYREFQRENGLRSIWSIYELPIHGFLRDHPYKGALQVAYSQHWGDDIVCEDIQGGTWADLYRAADRCIRRSGDDHHCFIEAFTVNPNTPQQLILHTGS